MTSAPFLAAVMAIAAVVGLGITLLVHIVRYAYQQGITHQRLTAVERTVADSTLMSSAVAGLTATMEALKGSIERLDRAVERLEERPSPRPSLRKATA